MELTGSAGASSRGALAVLPQSSERDQHNRLYTTAIADDDC
jgi:hypothetical protein